MTIESRLDLPHYLIEKKLLLEGAEVGILFAEFSCHILKYWPGKLHMVDPWIQQDPRTYLDGSNAVDMEAAYRESVERVRQFGARANIVRLFSERAAAIFPSSSLDFVYIDANHAYPWIKADLANWWPKIRSGGLMCGHDYADVNTRYWSCGVKSAVDEFVNSHNLELCLTPECTSWWITKP